MSLTVQSVNAAPSGTPQGSSWVGDPACSAEMTPASCSSWVSAPWMTWAQSGVCGCVAPGRPRPQSPSGRPVSGLGASSAYSWPMLASKVLLPTGMIPVTGSWICLSWSTCPQACVLDVSGTSGPTSIGEALGSRKLPTISWLATDVGSPRTWAWRSIRFWQVMRLVPNSDCRLGSWLSWSWLMSSSLLGGTMSSRP